MLITSTRTLEQNVSKSVVETEANALDQTYMKAYGEPKVITGGVLTYPDATRTAQVVTTLDAFAGTEEDIPNDRTILYFRTGAVDIDQIKAGDTITITGVTSSPELNNTFDVVAVDAIHNSIAIDGTGIAMDLTFNTAVNIGTATIGVQIQGNVVSGYVVTSEPLTVVHLRTDTTINLSGVTVDVDTILLSGITLAPELNGEFTILAFDNGAKTVTISVMGLTVPVTVNFAVDTPEGNLVHHLSAVSFTAPSSEVYVRSGSPFEYKLSQSSDIAASAKVKAWADDLRVKITAAMSILKDKDDPNTSYPIIETSEV